MHSYIYNKIKKLANLSKEEYDKEWKGFTIRNSGLQNLERIYAHKNQPYFDLTNFELNLMDVLKHTSYNTFQNSFLSKVPALQKFFKDLIENIREEIPFLQSYSIEQFLEEINWLDNKTYFTIINEIIDSFASNRFDAYAKKEFFDKLRSTPRINKNYIDYILVLNHSNDPYLDVYLGSPSIDLNSKQLIKPLDFIKFILKYPGSYENPSTYEDFLRILQNVPPTTRKILHQFLFVNQDDKVFAFDETFKPIDEEYNPVNVTFFNTKTHFFENLSPKWKEYFNDFKIVPFLNYFQ